MDKYQIALALIALFSLMVTAIGAPLLVARQVNNATSSAKKQDAELAKAAKKAEADAAKLLRDEDYARQDIVAARVQAAVDAAAKRADDAATLLLTANERNAAQAAVSNGKLDQIHVLVNSEKTAALAERIRANKRWVVAQREIGELKRVAHVEPSPEAVGEISAAVELIAKLEAELADRIARNGISAEQTAVIKESEKRVEALTPVPPPGGLVVEGKAPVVSAEPV